MLNLGSTMSDTYTIFCVLEGEDNAFGIKIQRNETVHFLKQEIKKQITDIGWIDARNLELYRVDAPGKSKKERLQAIRDLRELKGNELDPQDKLSELYPSPAPEKMIHIVVVPPQISE
jgi:hypothetical protein